MSWLSRWMRRPRTAAEWFAHLRLGKISRRTDARFKQWLADDAEHELEYERQELAWELAFELEQDAEIDALVKDAARPAQHPMQRIVTPQRSSHFVVGWSAAASVLAITVLAAWLWHAQISSGQLYTTGIGERRTVVLQDHSQVTLNTATRLRVAFTRSVRAITLETGEATFVVAHDSAHPFEVSAAGGKARALGTQFNVFKNADDVAVTVLEGTVDVTPAIDSTYAKPRLQHAVLTAGQEVHYTPHQLMPTQVAQTDRIYAWQAGRVVFQDMSLESAIVEFNRYSQIPLVLGDRSLATRHVSGVFRVGETEALLNALKEAFGVRAVRNGNSIILWPANRATSDVITTQR